jgi:arginase family enzyme
MRVLNVPFNAGNLKEKDGIEDAPTAITGALDDYYLNEEGVLPVFDIQEVLVDNDDIDGSHDAITNAVRSSNAETLVLGGDHSITAPAFEGFAYGKDNPGMIVFDAHPDLMEPFDTHEDYLRTLIEDGILGTDNVILVGIRNWDKEEKQYLEKNDIQHFAMREFEHDSIEDISDTVMMNARAWSDLYVSIDIDVLDCAFAPGTGYPEPGGFTTRELLYFVHRLRKQEHFRMADIVEVNPRLDVNNITIQAAAKIAVEMA